MRQGGSSKPVVCGRYRLLHQMEVALPEDGRVELLLEVAQPVQRARRRLKARLRAVVRHSGYRGCSRQTWDRSCLGLEVVVVVREHLGVQMTPRPVLRLV